MILDGDDLRCDCALAAGLLIAEMVQARPPATTPELVSFCTYAILEAIREAERRGVRHAAQPSAN